MMHPYDLEVLEGLYEAPNSLKCDTPQEGCTAVLEEPFTGKMNTAQSDETTIFRLQELRIVNYVLEEGGGTEMS